MHKNSPFGIFLDIVIIVLPLYTKLQVHNMFLILYEKWHASHRHW